MGYSDRRAAEKEILQSMLCADMMVQTNVYIWHSGVKIQASFYYLIHKLFIDISMAR